MIQITGLRPINGDFENQFDGAFFKDNWRAPSVPALFANLSDYLKQIPAKERWNLFFTACVCTDKKRDFFSTDVLWFDLDGINLEHRDSYIDIVCDTLQIKKEETGIVCSGNGLHFYVGLETPIVDKNFFVQSKDHYKAVLELIGNACIEKDLPIKLDPSVFNARQIMRLPGTENRKPHKKKEPVACYLINAAIKPTKFSLAALSNIPDVAKTDSINTRNYEPGAAPVLQGCEFLKYCQANPGDITEPEWYAALSVVARCKDGRAEAHKLSEGHPKYSYAEADKKITQAITVSGPRTCSNIQSIWGNCGTCKHFGKLASPIQVTDPNDIKTKDTGFYHMVFDKKSGSMKLGKPDYEGLAKFFEQQNPFRSTDRTLWVFNKTHFELVSDDKLSEFAQEHFKPECRNHMVFEFKEMLWRTNVFTPDEWDASRENKVNFLNGILDLKTMKLLNHSPEWGFKYVLPYNYDAGAVAPEFEKFLESVTKGRKILSDTLLEFGGYALAGGDCKYQKALVLEGEGSNGKSTFIEVLKAVAGEKTYSSLSFSELNEREARVALDGALFNITEETPGKIYNTETFKNLVVGGEASVRMLFKNGYKFRNKAKLIFSCNELPLTSDNSGGMYRRFLIVPFKAKFSKENGNLDLRILEKLKSELPGVFNLFLKAWLALEKRGSFAKEMEPDDDLKEYKLLSDTVAYWANESVHVVEGAFTPNIELYKSYRAFCDDTGYEKQILPQNIFGKRLKQTLIGYDNYFEVRRVDGKLVKGLKNIHCGIYEKEEF